MDKKSYAESFKDLIVYQKARSVASQIFSITKTFPEEEKYSLINQVRRSSRSVGAQIAEAWAKRKYKKHFISKLTDADGEQQETQHWIETAHDCDYIDESTVQSINADLQEIGAMLNSMIYKADSFCGKDPYSIQEESSEYFIEQK